MCRTIGTKGDCKGDGHREATQNDQDEGPHNACTKGGCTRLAQVEVAEGVAAYA